MAAKLTDKYPIDFDLLEKGQTITVEELTTILGKKPGTDPYQFALLGLQALVNEKTALTAKITDKFELRILTDEEAARHNYKLGIQGVRAMRYRHQKALEVDIALLSDESRNQHERNLIVMSRYVSAITATSKQIAVEARKRMLPGKTPKGEIEEENGSK